MKTPRVIDLAQDLRCPGLPKRARVMRGSSRLMAKIVSVLRPVRSDNAIRLMCVNVMECRCSISFAEQHADWESI